MKFQIGDYVENFCQTKPIISGKIESYFLHEYQKIIYYNLKGVKDPQNELKLKLIISLKDLEDDEEAITFPNTHNHNTEVSLGGLTYARVIEMINGYTVTFEDGSYAVSLVGANSNISDVANVNQVSIRSNNSAGLVSLAEVLEILERIKPNTDLIPATL